MAAFGRLIEQGYQRVDILFSGCVGVCLFVKIPGVVVINNQLATVYDQ